MDDQTNKKHKPIKLFVYNLRRADNKMQSRCYNLSTIIIVLSITVIVNLCLVNSVPSNKCVKKGDDDEWSENCLDALPHSISITDRPCTGKSCSIGKKTSLEKEKNSSDINKDVPDWGPSERPYIRPIFIPDNKPPNFIPDDKPPTLSTDGVMSRDFRNDRTNPKKQLLTKYPVPVWDSTKAVRDLNPPPFNSEIRKMLRAFHNRLIMNLPPAPDCVKDSIDVNKDFGAPMKIECLNNLTKLRKSRKRANNDDEQSKQIF